ncbi:MAG TPA: hypothetical protein VH592_03595 [Gemmataceae bacterium]|jgi:hypothetical protein
MKLRMSYSRARLLVLALFSGVFAGCGSGYEKYVPAEDKARKALEAALNAWCEGKKPGLIEGAPVPTQAVDSRWLAGQKLRSFEIGSEEPNEGPRVFSVHLTLELPAGRQETVRYFIVGNDPLWVYREDDYKAPAGM